MLARAPVKEITGNRRSEKGQGHKCTDFKILEPRWPEKP